MSALFSRFVRWLRLDGVRAPNIQPSGWYIQHKGYSGDCLLWWREGRCGYTCNLDEAMVVDEAESKRICSSRPNEDIAWSKEFIDEITSRHVNSEHPTWRAAQRAIQSANAVKPQTGYERTEERQQQEK